jgi:hypothetical protein
MKRDEPPSPQIVKTDKGFRPYRHLDLTDLADDPIGTVYEMRKVTKRSERQMRTFWKALGIVVASTNRWPTKEKLCEELKFALGYRTKFRDWKTGAELERPDSIALSKMTKPDFDAFFEASMMLLSETCGFDPLEFLEEK